MFGVIEKYTGVLSSQLKWAASNSGNSLLSLSQQACQLPLSVQTPLRAGQSSLREMTGVAGFAADLLHPILTRRHRG